MYKNIFRSILILLALLLLLTGFSQPLTSGLEHPVHANTGEVVFEGEGKGVMELTSSTNTDIEGLCQEMDSLRADVIYLTGNHLP